MPLRAASREVVRELGMLEDTYAPAAVTYTQCHVLLELSASGVLTIGELAERLRLDKSVVSRAVRALGERRLLRGVAGEDRRQKPVTLSASGRRLAAKIDLSAGGRVDAALRRLAPAQRDTVVEGMALYAKALRRARIADRVRLRPITPADDRAVAHIIRTVMTEHGATGPGFAILDPEVGAMAAAYPDARSRYFVLDDDGDVVGGAGFGPLQGGDPETCELRKMYLLPRTRGLGLGRRLLTHVLQAAREAGFARCYLETMATMQRARALYESFGFRRRQDSCGATGHHGCDAWYELDLTLDLGAGVGLATGGGVGGGVALEGAQGDEGGAPRSAAVPSESVVGDLGVAVEQRVHGAAQVADALAVDDP